MEEIRYFQIIVPLVSLFFIVKQLREHFSAKSGIWETFIIVTFWIGTLIFALFPDFFSEWIARIFGIEDNINAILFFAIGLLFYIQLQLFKLVKKQDEAITELVRKLALEKSEEKLEV